MSSREEFEAAFAQFTRPFLREGDRYLDSCIDDAWRGWQARDAEIAALRAQAAGMRETAAREIERIYYRYGADVCDVARMTAAIRALPPTWEPDVERLAGSIYDPWDHGVLSTMNGATETARAILREAGWRGGE